MVGVLPLGEGGEARRGVLAIKEHCLDARGRVFIMVAGFIWSWRFPAAVRAHSCNSCRSAYLVWKTGFTEFSCDVNGMGGGKVSS